MMIIYSSPTCPKCHTLMDALTRENIEFQMIDITKDQDALKKLVAKGLQSLPIAEINEQFYTDPSLTKIKELI